MYNSNCFSIPWVGTLLEQTGLMTASPQGVTSGKGTSRVCVCGALACRPQAQANREQGWTGSWPRQLLTPP